MDQQVIEMGRAAFAEWAEQAYAVDYDDVMFWDMARDLSDKVRMPEGFEVGKGGEIPASLYDILMARKAHRDPAYVARNTERVQGEQEARVLVAQPEPWGRETWRRLVKLGYASQVIDTGAETGHASYEWSLTEEGMRLIDPSYRAPGMYADQVEG